MLDMKVLRTQMDWVRERLQHRGEDISGLDSFSQLDEQRRSCWLRPNN